MKTIYIIPFHIILFLSCNAQKGFIENDDLCKFDDIVLNNEKTISTTNKEDSILLHQGSFDKIDNEINQVRLFRHPNYGTITKTILNKETNIIKSLVYENKNLIGSFFRYKVGDLDIGKEIEYDANGSMIKMIDHSDKKNYPICFKEAMAIVEKKIPKKDTIFGIEREKKIIEKKETLYYWQVYVDEINNKPSRTIWIYKVDGATGKIFEKVRSIPSKH